jgi:DNA adenine methylase
MQYLGGKSKTWKEISQYVKEVRRDGQEYIEPFVGGGWVLQGVQGKRSASDANQALITMYQALQSGWIPPAYVDKEQYEEVKALKNAHDPITAFIGFGCSFSGKWFGGYARDSAGRNYASNAKNSLIRQLPLISDVSFSCKSYSEWSPVGCIIYCDPPYANTTGYNAVGEFDSANFWQTMREWSESNTVIVSEYEAPDDFICVKEIATKTDMHTKVGKDARTEKIFTYGLQ